jgi:hypothetical protein
LQPGTRSIACRRRSARPWTRWSAERAHP